MTTLIDNIRGCAQTAGDIAMSYFRADNTIECRNKLNDSDIVTVADKAVESHIIEFIRHNYPSHSILSEESSPSECESDWRWVIDPIDGTSNFFSGLPIWAISIAVEYKGDAVAGVVHLPAIGETFYAEKGRGAFLNGRPIRVGSETSLSKVLVATGFPVDKATNPDNNLDVASRILPLVRDLRRIGSASVDMCYVAAGYLGGYWEMNLHIWDICASKLILEEAGGAVSQYRSDRNISIVCGNTSVHDQLLSIINETLMLQNNTTGL